MATQCPNMRPAASLCCSRQLRPANSHAFRVPRKLRQRSLWLQPLEQQHTQRGRQGRKCKLLMCASVLPLASIAVQQAAHPTAALLWPAMLSSAGVFLVCCAGAVLLLSAIPLLWSLAKTANRMESMLQTLESELPDTAASMRLSSLELSDCLNELGALGNDLSGGVRASARLVTAAEGGLRQGAQLLGSSIVPALARRETQVRDVLEAALKARAALAPRIPEARAAVNSTTKGARRLRGALTVARVVFDLGQFVRIRLTEAALQQYVAGQRMAASAAVGAGAGAGAGVTGAAAGRGQQQRRLQKKTEPGQRQVQQQQQQQQQQHEAGPQAAQAQPSAA